MKYLFVTGAPGSQWSSVVRNIYFSPEVNQSDYSVERTYYHAAKGTKQLMHLGSYFDPGMEFGDNFDVMNFCTVEECEEEFNRPFTHDMGIKIVKSHFFAYHLDFMKENWKDPIILVQKDPDACIGWWIRCGHFNITYPSYKHYGDIDRMVGFVDAQDKAITKFIQSNDTLKLNNSFQLADALGIHKENVYFQEYGENKQNVYLYWKKFDGNQVFLA